jgi:hypothetical protein
VSVPERPDPEQLGLDLDTVPAEHLRGGMPADPMARDEAMRAWYRAFLADLCDLPTCQPDRGVHIYTDHRGTGPCLCQRNDPPTPEGVP